MSEIYPFHESPLYQLNLMLWLVWSRIPAQKSGIYPVFRLAGYKLQSLGQIFNTSLQAQALASKHTLPFQPNFKPEMVLMNDSKKTLILLECKASAFHLGHQDRCKQANAMLSSTGEELADRIGFQNPVIWGVAGVFAVKGSDESLMYDTLKSLSEQLRDIGILPSGSSALGIYSESSGVTLRAYPHKDIPLDEFQNSSNGEIKVLALEEGEDPRQLFLIPYDPTIPNDFPDGVRVLEERLRAAFVSLVIKRADEESDFDIEMDEIMQATLELWQIWKDREATDGIKRLAVGYIRAVIPELKKAGISVNFVTKGRRVLEFRKVTPKHSQELKKIFMTKEFRASDVFQPESNQLGFDEHSEEWE